MKRGFSLIELMVVLLIMTVCTAVALPAFVSGEHRNAAYSTAQHVSTVIRNASQRASRLGHPVSLVIDDGHYEVRSVDRDARLTVIRDTFHVLAGVRIEPAGVHVARFLPNGAAWGDSLVILSDTTRLVIRLSPIGEPRVTE